MPATRTARKRAPSASGPVAVKAVADIGDGLAGTDGHAVPATLAVMGELVADHLEGHHWRRLVGQLRLLHQQHVRLTLLQPAPRPGAGGP